MITTSKKPEQGKPVPPAPSVSPKLVEAINGVLDEKKLNAILGASDKEAVKELVSEIRSLKEIVVQNTVKEWAVEIKRNSQGVIESLTYKAVE